MLSKTIYKGLIGERSMQHLDIIAELVRSAALEVSGCDPSLIGGIDSHSTIVLDLFALPYSYQRQVTMMGDLGAIALTAWWYYNKAGL